MRAVLFFLALSAPALAYLDPITGNILVQAILAVFAGLALGFHRVKIFFQGLFGKKKAEPKKDETAKSEEKAKEEESQPEKDEAAL